MASKNKTENLKLSQWEAGEAFTREDLNADFRVIDAAVGQGGLFTKIKDVSVSAAGKTQIDLDVSDIDFTQWQYVMIDVTVGQSCKVKINDQTTWCSCWSFGSSSVSGCWGLAETGTRLIFPTFGRNGSAAVFSQNTDNFGAVYYFGRGPVKYSDFKTVNLFLESGSFTGTAEFVILGVK